MWGLDLSSRSVYQDQESRAQHRSTVGLGAEGPHRKIPAATLLQGQQSTLLQGQQSTLMLPVNITAESTLKITVGQQSTLLQGQVTHQMVFNNDT